MSQGRPCQSSRLGFRSAVQLEEHQLGHQQPEGARELSGHELGDERLGPLAGAAKLDHVETEVVGLDQGRHRAAFPERLHVANGADGAQLLGTLLHHAPGAHDRGRAPGRRVRAWGVFEHRNLGFLSSVRMRRERFAKGYPFDVPAIAGIDSLALHPKVTFFTGENGSGKSTLIEAIAIAAGFNAEGGSVNFRFANRPSESSLHGALTLVRTERRPRTGFFLRAESFFNVATEIERLDAIAGPGPKVGASYGARPLHEQSHGESFWSLLERRFGNDGLYLFDEPESALSPQRQLQTLQRIHQLARGGSQFLISTHSPLLLAYPNALVYELSSRGIGAVPYEATAVVDTYMHFFMNREQLLADLVDDA